MSVARSLGLESVRVSYVDEIGQYLRIDLLAERSLTVFVDHLKVDFAELKEQGYFVNASGVLALFERMGFQSILESRKPVDKQIFELWVAAVFTLCLGRGGDHYVGLVRDDPPDAEVVVVDQEPGALRMIRVEVTRHGRYSRGMLEVIGKKLLKRYHDGTVVVVLVEKSESFSAADLLEFIQSNNPHNQRIFIIGGGREQGTYKVIPCDKISSPTPDETAWMEVVVGESKASKGHLGYEGIMFKPPYSRWVRSVNPVFVKKVELDR